MRQFAVFAAQFADFVVTSYTDFILETRDAELRRAPATWLRLHPKNLTDICIKLLKKL
jgi:hypothetical protein